MSKQPTTPPPAYFLSLSLENVRSFGEKQTISLAGADGRPAQWTIILGDNGVGKTTVLKALALSMRNEDADEFGRRQKVWSYIYKIWNPMRSTNHVAMIHAVNTVGEKLINSDVAGSDSKTNKRGELTFGVFVKPHKESEYTYRRLRDNFSVGSHLQSSVGKWGKELTCYGYGAGRTIGNSTLSDSPEDAETCISLFDDRADLLNPEEWFLQMDYSSFKGYEQAGELLERVRLALVDVLPDVTDIRIKSADIGQQQYLELETHYGWVRLRDMSLGYQTLVVWLTDFASKLFIRYPESKNPLEEPAIVLIDEIDLHLHPSWQRKLIGFLSGIFKNTQFIATAHSPLVVQAAGDQPSGANVVLLKRVGDQTIVYQGEDLPDVRSWRLDQILSSELFDEVPAHSPETEKKLQRRDALLAKARLTAKEKKELAELNEWDNQQPIGDSEPERKAADVLRELARKLGKQDLLD